jgi:hypothetical protein
MISIFHTLQLHSAGSDIERRLDRLFIGRGRIYCGPFAMDSLLGCGYTSLLHIKRLAIHAHKQIQKRPKEGNEAQNCAPL